MTPRVIATTGTRKVVFTEAASPAAIPASTSGPLSSSAAPRSGASCTAPAAGRRRPALGAFPPRPRLRRPPLVAVDQEGGKGEQEGQAHDVVAPLPGLRF